MKHITSITLFVSALYLPSSFAEQVKVRCGNEPSLSVVADIQARTLHYKYSAKGKVSKGTLGTNEATVSFNESITLADQHRYFSLMAYTRKTIWVPASSKKYCTRVECRNIPIPAHYESVLDQWFDLQIRLDESGEGNHQLSMLDVKGFGKNEPGTLAEDTSCTFTVER